MITPNDNICINTIKCPLHPHKCFHKSFKPTLLPLNCIKQGCCYRCKLGKHCLERFEDAFLIFVRRQQLEKIMTVKE